MSWVVPCSANSVRVNPRCQYDQINKHKSQSAFVLFEINTIETPKEDPKTPEIENDNRKDGNGTQESLKDIQNQSDTTLDIQNQSDTTLDIQNQSDTIYQDKQIQSNTTLDIEIRGPQDSPSRHTRPPINLAIVFDKSGSMAGPKLEFAKIATKDLIQQMIPGDLIHLVTFSNEAQIVFEDGNVDQKERLLSLVDDIRSGGGTNLYDALHVGYQLLHPFVDKSLKRVFLFSDGLASRGPQILQNVSRYVTHGITVSAFGIGSGFDEELMRGIAENGSGDYFFMENVESIPTYVSSAVSGLIRVIGTNAVFQIVPENGTIVKQLYGSKNPGEFEYMFGDLTFNNTRNIFSELEFNPPPDKNEGTYLAATWKLSYNSVTLGTKVSLSGQFYLNIHPEFRGPENLEVLTALKIKETGEIDLRCKQLLDAKKLPELIALKTANLQELKNFVHQDKTGRIQILIDLGEKSLKELQKETRHPQSHLDPNIRKRFDSSNYYCKNDNKYHWDSSQYVKNDK